MSPFAISDGNTTHNISTFYRFSSLTSERWIINPQPGAMALTRMPYGAKFVLACFVRCAIADLLAEYAGVETQERLYESSSQ